MELEQFADIVDKMILEHDYPGFEPRALRLGLPEEALRMPAKTYSQALVHTSIYVKIAALRWFQEKPGVAKSYIKAVAGLLHHADEFVRMESVRTLERINGVPDEIILEVSAMLRDPNTEVRKAAAKALGKLGKKAKEKNQAVLQALQEASHDPDPGVRMKAQKASRLIAS
jgi:HEAT repeat protein